MDPMIVVALIGGFEAIVLAILAYMIKKHEKKVNTRATLYAKERKLAMQQTDAMLQLLIADTRAIQNGDTNGAITKALEKAALAEEAYKNFLMEIGNEAVLKDR